MTHPMNNHILITLFLLLSIFCCLCTVFCICTQTMSLESGGILCCNHAGFPKGNIFVLCLSFLCFSFLPTFAYCVFSFDFAFSFSLYSFHSLSFHLNRLPLYPPFLHTVNERMSIEQVLDRGHRRYEHCFTESDAFFWCRRTEPLLPGK